MLPGSSCAFPVVLALEVVWHADTHWLLVGFEACGGRQQQHPVLCPRCVTCRKKMLAPVFVRPGRVCLSQGALHFAAMHVYRPGVSSTAAAVGSAVWPGGYPSWKGRGSKCHLLYQHVTHTIQSKKLHYGSHQRMTGISNTRTVISNTTLSVPPPPQSWLGRGSAHTGGTHANLPLSAIKPSRDQCRQTAAVPSPSSAPGSAPPAPTELPPKADRLTMP